MNIEDLFNLVNKMNTLIDEGIEEDSTLEEVNEVLREEFGMSEVNGFYATVEDFQEEWILAEKMCMMYDKVISGEGL